MEPATMIDDELGAPNLDGMTDTDLHMFAAATRGVAPRTAARRLFPHERRGATTAVKRLNAYAWNLITARACRLRGDVATALQYERICERIYSELPDWARW
jgi:hypothetical protein